MTEEFEQHLRYLIGQAIITFRPLTIDEINTIKEQLAEEFFHNKLHLSAIYAVCDYLIEEKENECQFN